MSQDSVRVEQAALETTREPNKALALLRTSLGRNLGLVIALLLICLVGVITAGDRFASTANTLTILKLASTIGVVSIGMTFVIIGGGIDLSVGAIVALSSVWCTTVATQTMAEDVHWLVMVGVALAVGAGCGLVNGLLISYGRIVPFIMTLAMLASARGLAEIISDRKTQIVKVDGFADFFNREIIGIPMQVWIFALVALVGWIMLNRTTFGRRTVAVGGNPEAARLAGINGQAADRLPLRAGRRLLRHRRADAGRPDHHRQRDARQPLRARRDRRGRHRRHPAHRRPRHDRRHRARRPDLHDAQQRLHPQQPLHLGAGSSPRE